MQSPAGEVKLGSVAQQMDKEGVLASPVIISSQGVPKMVVIPFSLFERAASHLDLLQAAEVAAHRLGASETEELESMCADFGVDPERVREYLSVLDEEGADAMLVEQPSFE